MLCARAATPGLSLAYPDDEACRAGRLWLLVSAAGGRGRVVATYGPTSLLLPWTLLATASSPKHTPLPLANKTGPGALMPPV
ncbi:hypothetical protein CDD81_6481 [Ophiocordyceps australis]|uniref:Uncharacterized protein n=1 Tax=Ophiocordyceps australis TaxID=1399860 RepID=A0A2C5YI32_9HYPO|nr:hypothetical protein CDD81_6481 [Ophiocordyceps australis]